MRHALLALALTLFAVPAHAEDAEHVVLVSIDGLRPEFYLDSSWPAPTLQRLAKEGAHARAVRGVFPTVTYPSHTTLVTGALPGRHGIISNTPFEEGGQTGRWFWNYSSIRTPTLFDALKRAGKETAAVSWPVTVGAPITRNFFPEVWSLDRGRPPLEATRRATTPQSLIAEVEQAATGALDGRRWSMRYLGRDLIAGQAAAHLLEAHKPTLLAVHFVGADHFQHDEGRDGPLVRRAVSTCDSALTLLLEAAERAGIAKKTAFIITGDHGFVDIHTQLNPNVWLAKAGLQEARRDRGDWKAAFLTSGGSALLRVRGAKKKQTVAAVLAALGKLPRGVRQSFRIIDKQTLRACGADRDAHLALSAAPGFSFGKSNEGDAVTPAGIRGTHGFFPDFPEIHTGFVGWGAGFRPHAVAPQIGLEDVAPLISKLLDLRFKALDGAAPLGLLAPPPRIPRGAKLYK